MSRRGRWAAAELKRLGERLHRLLLCLVGAFGAQELRAPDEDRRTIPVPNEGFSAKRKKSFEWMLEEAKRFIQGYDRVLQNDAVASPRSEEEHQWKATSKLSQRSGIRKLFSHQLDALPDLEEACRRLGIAALVPEPLNKSRVRRQRRLDVVEVHLGGEVPGLDHVNQVLELRFDLLLPNRQVQGDLRSRRFFGDPFVN
eukprot:scaffold111_cov252-Pinguiococcus_pyrenoidosus.AAC.28